MVITVYVHLLFTLPSFSSVIKQIKRKMLPKDGKIIRPVRNFLILTVRELLFCLLYHLFGSFMTGLKRVLKQPKIWMFKMETQEKLLPPTVVKSKNPFVIW
jgi:hypothetical protein